MKIRTSFVTNSSSSSFFLCTTKVNFDRAYEKARNYVKAVIDWMGHTPQNFNNKQVVILSTMNVQDTGTFEYCDIAQLNPDDYPSEAWDEFKTILNEEPDAVVTARKDL